MAITLQHPLKTPPARITGEFAERRSNGATAGGKAIAKVHGGRDYAPEVAGDTKTIARAVGPGRVVAVRDAKRDVNQWDRPIYNDNAGHYAITEHTGLAVRIDGFVHTRLWVGECHLAVVGVDVHDYKHTGDPLGIVGATGAATGPHVHLDVFTESPHLGDYAFDRRVDPRLVLGDWPKAAEPITNLEVPMPILLDHEGRKYLLRAQPTILDHEGTFHLLVGDEQRHIADTQALIELRAALTSWRRAEQRGAVEFGLGRYNGEELLKHLGDFAVEVRDATDLGRIRGALGDWRASVKAGQAPEFDLGRWGGTSLLRYFTRA